MEPIVIVLLCLLVASVTFSAGTVFGGWWAITRLPRRLAENADLRKQFTDAVASEYDNVVEFRRES
jgi:hypothetical protein